MSESLKADAVVIGGGYYGCLTALEIKNAHPDWQVMVLEKASTLFARASSTNQMMLQQGYLYSGDPALAQDCVQGVRRFEERFGGAVNQHARLRYAIHRESEISADDYKRFCDEVGLPLQRIDEDTPTLTAMFETAEKTFDNQILQALFRRALDEAGVACLTEYAAKQIVERGSQLTVVGGRQTIRAGMVFNATFADINGLHQASGLSEVSLHHDVFLHFRLGLPQSYQNLGTIVVRGPFASLTPMGPQDHVLASGRFRKIHTSQGQAPPEAIDEAAIRSLYGQAVDEASAYLPVLQQATYRGPIIGTRTAFFDQKTQKYSSKALVFPNYGGMENYHVVLGGKVGCMFDIVEPLRQILEASDILSS